MLKPSPVRNWTRYNFLIFVPLILAAFLHLWNPAGFPSIHGDEGHYMRRALILLDGGPPQEDDFRYDHPFFGQMILAGLLAAVGYPDIVHFTSDANASSMENLHHVPRTLIGVLSIIDTFFIYKIAEHRYNSRTAFVAAILFAVMPSGWLSSRILLESIQLPLILASILFSLRIWVRNQKDILPGIDKKHDKRYTINVILVMTSGIFLGLATFTKLPAIAFVPLLAYLVFINSNRSFKMLGIWFAPVILIPMLWPAYSLAIGEFDEFLEGIFWQSGRADRGQYSVVDLFRPDVIYKMADILVFDPFLVIVGTGGIIFASIKRDYFLGLWLIPIIVFFSLLGFVRTFFLIPMLPVFSIAAAVLISALLDKASIRRVSRIVTIASVSAITVFGLTSTFLLVNINVNSAYFELYSVVVGYLPENLGAETDDTSGVTIVGNDWVISGLSWIPSQIYGKDHEFKKYYSRAPVETEKVLLVVDKRMRDELSDAIVESHIQQVRSFYTDGTGVVYQLNDRPRYDYSKYPYASMRDNRGIGVVELRSNY
ncbi:MAG TPA: glycosyltransferase family 39 protein [Nitrososphaeraceae archaeon]|nr:glycosyltransferase family 39 protein [Nitrososphaeraceae archaeon]